MRERTAYACVATYHLQPNAMIHTAHQWPPATGLSTSTLTLACMISIYPLDYPLCRLVTSPLSQALKTLVSLLLFS